MLSLNTRLKPFSRFYHALLKKYVIKMTEYYLKCNILKCGKELKDQAWVTCCSHIFCMDHGQVTEDKEKCLTCNTNFENQYDIVVVDLNPCEAQKSMVLTGLSPEKVLDIASRAMNFWSFQVHHEKVLRDEMYKNVKQQCAELIHYCETITTEHKMEVKKINRDNEEYQRQLEIKDIQVKELVEQVFEKSKLVKSLQSQNDALKRKVSILIQKYGDENINDDTDKIHLNHYTAHPRQKYRKCTSDNHENKQFVFNPVFGNSK